jgi:hypothetical protein
MSASADRFIPEAGKVLEWFADAYEESISRQVKTGYVQADRSDPGMYSPTIQGAYLMTWGQLPPMKQMRRSEEDKRAAEQVRQALASPVTAPGSVRITHAGTGTSDARKAA